MNEQPNYYHRAHLTWLKYCATIINPCGKELGKVIAYLTENYDTEPVILEKSAGYSEEFAQYIDAEHYLDLCERAINKLDLCESDMAFTIASMSSSNIVFHRSDKVDRETFTPQCLRIPLTERNQNRIARLDISFHTTGENQMYRDCSCGYVLWDENLQYFYATGYGQFEIMDDLRFYHGVTAEDIQNLTYRFSRFAQLFPRGGYSISFDEFRNDMNMSLRYGFYNDQRLFTEMLDKIKVSYEFSDVTGNVLKQQWFDQFVPLGLHVNSEKRSYFSRDGYNGYLWHVFSYRDLGCLEGKQAEVAFDTRIKDECAVFFTDHNYIFKIMNARNLCAKVLDDFSEVFVVDKNFKWTYIHTHEGYCGPYFYEIGVEYENASTSISVL